MRSLGWGFIHSHWCLYKRAVKGSAGGSHVMTAVREVMQLQAKEHQHRCPPLEARKRQERMLPSLPREHGPTVLLIQTSSLQKFETMNVYCSQPPNLLQFAMAALGNQSYSMWRDKNNTHAKTQHKADDERKEGVHEL